MRGGLRTTFFFVTFCFARTLDQLRLLIDFSSGLSVGEDALADYKRSDTVF